MRIMISKKNHCFRNVQNIRKNVDKSGDEGGQWCSVRREIILSSLKKRRVLLESSWWCCGFIHFFWFSSSKLTMYSLSIGEIEPLLYKCSTWISVDLMHLVNVNSYWLFHTVEQMSYLCSITLVEELIYSNYYDIIYTCH